jgi:hypothetical protein
MCAYSRVQRQLSPEGLSITEPWNIRSDVIPEVQSQVYKFNTLERSQFLLRCEQLPLSNRSNVHLENNLAWPSHLGQRLSINRRVFHHTQTKNVGC